MAVPKKRTEKMTAPTWENSTANKGTDARAYISTGGLVEELEYSQSSLRMLYQLLATPLKADECLVLQPIDEDQKSPIIPIGVYRKDATCNIVFWNTATKTQTSQAYRLAPALVGLSETDRDRWIAEKLGDLLEIAGDNARNFLLRLLLNQLQSIYVWTESGKVETPFRDTQKATGDNVSALETAGDPNDTDETETSASLFPLLVSAVGIVTRNPILTILGLGLRFFRSAEK